MKKAPAGYQADSAISFIKSRPKPLALYLFSQSSTLRRKVWNEVSFGGGMVNDVLMHFVHDELPFGGVGNSGMYGTLKQVYFKVKTIFFDLNFMKQEVRSRRYEAREFLTSYILPRLHNPLIPYSKH